MSILMRKANSNDLTFFFELKTEKQSRINSLENKKITPSAHKNWFLQKIKNKKNILLVAIKNNNKIGIIRYDISEYFAEVSITIDLNFRGQGHGAKILKKSESFLKKGTIIISKVKKTNKISLVIFKKNAYKVLSLKNKVYNLYKIF